MKQTHPAHTTICALSTGSGGAIGVIRISGAAAIEAVNRIFSKNISVAEGHTAHFGLVKNGEEIIDEAVVTVFRTPHSFTGEDVVEISCHGSRYIQQKILSLLLSNGCEAAAAGEFTMRAFMNGKMDLSQAEAVADLIASENAASHRLAIQQLRGGFSDEIKKLRSELLDFASLIELELDFAEEDVEFADRSNLVVLVDKIQGIITRLIDSFAYGNVIKNGVPVVIVGVPNVGKSTLLNALLNENKAIVSDIPGTTRDVIEDTVVINGVQFRFIDTAGLRDTRDVIENMGIEKAWKKIDEAAIVLYLVDIEEIVREETEKAITAFRKKIQGKDKKLVVVANKVDKLQVEKVGKLKVGKAEQIKEERIAVSAKEGTGLDVLKNILSGYVSENEYGNDRVVVTNARHEAALKKANVSLAEVRNGLVAGTKTDLVAIDIRKALFHLGEITGEITTDDLLGNIFSRFCIGK